MRVTLGKVEEFTKCCDVVISSVRTQDIVMLIRILRNNHWVKLSLLIILILYLSVQPFFYKGDSKSNRTYLYNTEVNFPHSNDNPSFTFYDDKHLFSVPTLPQAPINSEHSKLFENAKKIAAKHLKTEKSNFQNGLYRLLADGVEFDLYFSVKNSLTRISIFMPFGSPSYIHEFREPKKVVNIIIALKRKLNVFADFVDHIVNKIYPVDKNITLTIAYFSDSTSDEARDLLRLKLKKAPLLKWSFVMLEGPVFSRGQGLQAGAKSIGKKSSDLLFFCDVDILISPDFFERCRVNSIENKQVYYPIVYSLYNPKVVYTARGEKLPAIHKQIEVQTDNGFWRDFGYGMACMHRSEFDSVGGIPDLKSWGGEDVKLYENLKATNKIKEIRSPDPGLIHMYHSKNCTGVSRESKASCLTSKVYTEGSQLQLGLSLFKINESIDIAAALVHKPGLAEYCVIVFLLLFGLAALFGIVLFRCKI